MIYQLLAGVLLGAIGLTAGTALFGQTKKVETIRTIG